MTTDVGTTPRKALTPTQRLKLFEAHKGSCGICGAQIRAGDQWIDEHIIPLGLGGSNDMENRAPVHVQCAHSKTHGSQGDVAKIAKAKRQKMKSLGISRPKQKIMSHGFPKFQKEKQQATKIAPRRAMFEDAQ
jgi:5-methylcytosine-specific restriction endonuclease McrA